MSLPTWWWSLDKLNQKQFWNEQGLKQGIKAVNFDENMHILANKAIEPHVSGCKDVLDLGCGNGMVMKHLAHIYPETKFTGIDFSNEMIKQAKQDNSLKNTTFICEDALNLNYLESFDLVIGKRILINIFSNDERIKILDIIENALKDGGRYLMVENFIEPLSRINELRALLGYNIITVHDFNSYLTSDFVRLVERKDMCMIKEVDFGSLYYFISRIFNPDGCYDAKINKDAVKMSMEGHTSIIQGYCPEKIIIFEKIQNPPLFSGYLI